MSFECPHSIRVDRVSKCYAVFEKPSDRLKQMAASGLQRITGIPQKRYFEPFWALRDVSFEVARGECVGIVGRNGSGKSTLLQIITGTLSPTAGNVHVSGRVAALLELGSGFNPEFTGLENVHLNASLLGLDRAELESKLDAILAFADIGEFIDRPVKTYSSGMVVRLAFAVQAQIDPDVLIVDEALAVGDARFQAKCFARLEALRQQGTSILLVTHSTEQVVQHCDRAVLLDGGRKIDDGSPRQIVNRYLDLLYSRDARQGPAALQAGEAGNSDERPRPEVESVDPLFFVRAESMYAARPTYNAYEHRWGDGKAEIIDHLVIANGVAYPRNIPAHSILTCYVRCRVLEPLVRPIFGVTLKTKEGVTIYGTNSELTPLAIPFDGEPGDKVIECSFPLNCAAGDYFLSFGLASREVNGDVVPHDRRYDSIHFFVDVGEEFLGVTDLRATLRIA